jgi:hypothetical protein
MADYNIIYTSAENGPYLWNGNSFDRLNKKENEKLLFSGKSYGDDELPAALSKALEIAKRTFPEDSAPAVKPVEINVENGDNEAGHTPHITS